MYVPLPPRLFILRLLFLSLFHYRRGRRPRKQSCKALMFRPTAVKHFNLFDALASDDADSPGRPSSDAAGWNSEWIFPKYRMPRLSMGASAVGSAQKRCRKVINHVPRLRDILRMQSSLSGEAFHRSSFVRCPADAFTPARFWNRVRSIRNRGIVNR